MNPIGLYIHVPFCKKKCPYCDFYSCVATQALMDKYTETVIKILKDYSQKSHLSFDTVYFGGGTPSLLGVKNLSKIVTTVKNNFEFSAKEVTLEVNPTPTDLLDFEKLREIRINRLSIGLQSAVDSELKLLGRQHSVKDVERVLKLAKSAGFTNISLDLMVATPKQTLNSLKESIDFCVAQNVQHISAYLLKLEKGTLFYKNKEKLNLKTEQEEAEMYLFLVSELEKNGFKQYEISNFSKDGYKGIHNLKYWNAEEYLGIGPSAHSFLDGRRFFYPRSLNNFLSEKAKTVDDGVGGTIEEYIMLKLRLCEGLNNEAFKSRFDTDIPEVYLKKAKEFQRYGLTFADGKNIRLTTKGFLLSNEIISRVIF